MPFTLGAVNVINDAVTQLKASQAFALTVAQVIKDAVKDFKAAFAANQLLITRGQSQVMIATTIKVEERVLTEFARVGSVDPDVQAAFDNYVKNVLSKPRADAVLHAVKHKQLETTLPETVKAFSPDPEATKAWANGLFNTIWGSNAITPPPPIINPTAQKVRAAFEVEKDACHATTVAMARKFLHAKRPTLTSIPANYSSGQIAHAVCPQTLEAGRRQTIRYHQAELDAAVGRIQAAIARGYLYKIGVESGLNHLDSGPRFPNPEHWLLLFAHDGADAFVFWDSTPFSSHLAQFDWGPGFGLLFHKFGRFSTAWDDSDFNELSDKGDHVYNQTRHRYQAYLAQPIP
jgi:hypothetical protein